MHLLSWFIKKINFATNDNYHCSLLPLIRFFKNLKNIFFFKQTIRNKIKLTCLLAPPNPLNGMRVKLDNS